MNNNPNYLLKVSSRIPPSLVGFSNYETLPATATTRIRDGYSSMFVTPIDIYSPESDYLLFDGGLDEQGRGLESFLETGDRSRAKRGLGLRAVRAAFITHAHYDHVAALHVLPKDIPVHISEADSRILSGSVHAEGPIPKALNKLGLAKVAMPWLNPELIVHDQEFTFGELTVRAIATPGHTTGSMSFLVRRGNENRAADLIVGDALDFKRNGRVKNANWIFTKDNEESHDSIVFLSNYQKEHQDRIDRVVGAHSRGGHFQAILDYAETV